VSDRWLPVSPAGRLDAFEWRAPLSGIAPPVIEQASSPSPPALPVSEQKIEGLAETPPAVIEADTVPPSRRRGAPDQPKAEAVIPLIHVPDDPGPDAAPIEENEPRADTQSSGWRKMFE
jgi:HemY protein